jgi:hypothetical protein
MNRREVLIGGAAGAMVLSPMQLAASKRNGLAFADSLALMIKGNLTERNLPKFLHLVSKVPSHQLFGCELWFSSTRIYPVSDETINSSRVRHKLLIQKDSKSYIDAFIDGTHVRNEDNVFYFHLSGVYHFRSEQISVVNKIVKYVELIDRPIVITEKTKEVLFHK